ncbi:hypothetical protein GCM10011607_32500 [Shewanella inventionis]|uniref:Uncharacterized protein n=1 Tax=Shewanella inventionis TaxID=1738770 RepID=A0ABQ1JKH1_9GAMM|nr:hypothetical protein GCM10011607_32500 [Shewanella inventionis]
MTEGEDDFSVPVRIGGVLSDFQNRVVFQQAVQNIQGFTRATGNDLGAEHGILIGYVGVDPDGFFIVAVIAGIV